MLLSDSEGIYLGTVNGTLSSYEARNLGVIWRLELGGEFVSEMLLVGNGIIVVTNPAAGGNGGVPENSTVRLIARDSGVTAWSAKLPYSERYYLGRLNGGVAAVNRHGVVLFLDITSGRVKWKTEPLGVVNTRPAFALGRMAFGTAEKQVQIISTTEGEPAGRVPLDAVPTSVSFSHNGGVITGDDRGNVTLFGPDNRPVWKFKSGAGVSSALETEKGVLITSLDNFVYLVSDYNGDVIWKRRLAGRVVESGLLVNGHLVVLINGENTGYVLDMESGKVADVVQSGERDLINRTPVFVRDKTFAITTIDTLETYAIGSCGSK